MAEYKSDIIELNGSAEKAFATLSNPENLKKLLDKAPKDRIPADKLEMLEKLEITPDSITVPGGPMGAVTLEVTERREPEYIEMKAAQLPVDVKLALHIEPVDSSSSRGVLVINAAIPPMLVPMASGMLKKVLDQCATMLSYVNFA